MATSMDTNEILRRLALSRDPLAWAALLEGHGPEILRVCRRILRDEALAEDAVQETLLQVRDRAGQFRGEGLEPAKAARDWVLRAACTTALQMLRGRMRERRRDMHHATERGVGAQAADAATNSSQREQADAVRRELERMPEHERMPVLLHYYGELGYEQIAETLQCPVGTAKTRVHRGIERLRERLAALGFVFAFGQLTIQLTDLAAQAAESGGACDAQRLDAWRSLLSSPRYPLLPEFKPTQGGLSTMLKIGMLAAAVMLAALTTFIAGRTNGADAPARPAAAPATPLAKAPPVQEKTEAETARPAQVPDRAPAAPARDPAAPPTAEERKALVESNNAFALDLFAKLKAKEGNLFFSPYSISTALGMTYSGARGNTAAEMAKALRFTLAQERVHPVMGALIADMNAPQKNGKPRGFQLSVANSLWGQKGYPFKQDFLNLTKESYGAGLTEVDFLKAAEDARVAINTWVEQKTKDKIKDLIGKGALTGENRLVLVNAIYFKGDWESPFKKERTKDEPFHFADGKQADTPMMHQTGHYRYMEEENKFQALELPYVNRELSMLVFLPAEAGGLAGFENTVTPENVAKWTAGMKSEMVRIGMPKFKMTWGTENLTETLKTLGMKDAFSLGTADFTGMADTKELFIGMVLHKAFVDVNEEGTEAAAATAVAMSGGGRPRPTPEPKVFTADRPFLFAIRDNESGSLLFVGRVADPKKN
ncbi:MAG: sigma-70 family RNA polymerase sigma factor [Planctomycetes bacterium]|nr:sigma-70 family RNA polymerase sigma factor [Planctomycetota bacterium]